jgi:hypothetical protein
VGSWWPLAAPTSVLVLGTVALGLFAQPFLRLAADAASEITDPTAYVTAVLGTPSGTAGPPPHPAALASAPALPKGGAR